MIDRTQLPLTHLTKNHSASLWRAEIVYLRATKDSKQSTRDSNLVNWQPYSAKQARLHEIAVSHAQMLWQLVSHKFIASKVHEIMVTST